jgi:uncharacterized SAM-binding protein YcdF (DUF218 family)
MIKLVVTVGVAVAAVAGLAWGISSYLGIDDLANCQGPDYKDSACAPADVIIAISGGDTSARTAEAIRLYKAGWAPKLIFSGAALDTSGPSNAEAMKKQALAASVPEADIILDTKAVDTNQNALGASALLTSKDKRIILVTSPYHQRRASLEFQRVLGDSVTVISHPTPNDKEWGPQWWLTVNGWWLGLSETAKSLVVSTWR